MLLANHTDQLNWDVFSAPSYALSPQGEWMPTGKTAQLRDDTYECIGLTSPTYEVFQNSSLRGLVMPMVEEGLLEIANIGTLKNGSKVFIQAQMTEEYSVVGEKHKGMITLLNSHDGTAALAAGVTTTRVICGNTFAMAMTDMETKLRHISGMADKVVDLSFITDFVNDGMAVYSKAAEILTEAKLTDKKLDRIIQAAFNKDDDSLKTFKAYNKIVTLTRSGKGNQGKTLWDAFNGVTDYLNHESSKNDDVRFRSTNFGKNAKVARMAMDMALTLA